MSTAPGGRLERTAAHELVAGYRTGALSPVEVTRAVLDALQALDPQVGAYLLVDAEAALAQAERSHRRWRRGEPAGPADGVPTAVKDLLLTRGWPTRRGSTLLAGAGPDTEDAPAVARLRHSGAVLIGKTTTPEFGWKGVTDSAGWGATGNPWQPSRTSGGSSGGSAAAVAMGTATWALGTDGGGSVRIPAGFTGTVGLKPTYGLVPAYPASPFGTLAHVGPMTRSARDAALMLDVITGPDARDWSAGPAPSGSFLAGLEQGVHGLRIALSTDLGLTGNDLGLHGNDPEVTEAVQQAALVLQAAGATVEPADPGFEDPVAAFDVLWSAGAAKVLQAFGEPLPELVDPGLRRCVQRGRSLSASAYLDATAVRMDLGRRMGSFHERYDLLLTPTLPIPAFPAGQDVPDGWPAPEWTSWTPYTYPFNLTQQPAVSVPCGFTRDGLPIGLQIVGPRHADALVLRAAHAYGVATTWADAVPPAAAAR